MAQIRLRILTTLALLSPSPFLAAEELTLKLNYLERHFEPQHIEAPSNTKILLQVTNSSKEVVEFESFKLNREGPVQPGETVSFHLPELSPGKYDFYDDFHQDVPEGEILVK